MRNVFVLGICACALAWAADPSYAGKWKMNLAKSDFGETTMTLENLAGGEIKANMDGQSYTFKTDGKDYMTPWGMTVAWKPGGKDAWDVTEKTNGKVTSTGTVKLSPDGKVMTMNSKRVKADGGTSDDTVTFHRASGGPGLAGKWKTGKMSSNSPEMITLTPSGADGLKIMLGNEGGVCDAKFDGKDYPAKGPVWPAGWTCVIAKDGDRGFHLTWKKDGKDMYKTTLTASADGKTLTESGSAAGTSEKFKVVYDKQ